MEEKKDNKIVVLADMWGRLVCQKLHAETKGKWTFSTEISLLDFIVTYSGPGRFKEKREWSVFDIPVGKPDPLSGMDECIEMDYQHILSKYKAKVRGENAN